jgi:pimeloyl-ACP methyl ester carboxylesterase
MCAMAEPTSDGIASLPPPSGPFAIGKVTVLWTDPSRIEPLEPNHKSRELMVDIWYPADPSAEATAEYLDFTAFELALGVDGLRKQFGTAYDAIKTGAVRTHATRGAPFARSIHRSPILIFSPGGGMVREVYSAQLEELASHGYTVAAISHTYDAIVAVFPDGHSIVYNSQRWPKPPSFEGESNLNQLEWHADDIRFVLDKLSAPSDSTLSPLPFAGRLDLTRVGAFGHSFGGITAAHACQKDQRIKACLNQDGAVSMAPYFLDVRGWGMDQAFMLIERAPHTTPPSDEEVAEMKIDRQRINVILTRLRDYKNRALRNTGKGSYRVVLQSDKTTHMDFSDLPYLGARARAEAETRARVLEAARDYTRAFFDRYVKGMKAPLLDGQVTSPVVETVEFFAPAKHSNPWR